MNALARYLPILQWLPAYRRESIMPDLAAGATVAVMLVPQAMAYALLAGLPPVVGLYAALIPPIVYVFFGTSRQLAVGPVAIDSLLVGAGIASMAAVGTAHAAALAALLALMVGSIQIALGLLRVGRWSRLLTPPVLTGFTAGAAVLIAVSQLPHVLGVALPGSSVFAKLWAGVTHVGDAHLPTLGLALVALALLVALRRFSRRIPGALVVVVVGVGAVMMGLPTATVGEVPAGLPHPSLPDVDVATILPLFTTALIVALVSFMEGFSVASVFERSGKPVDANQELVALGMANVGGGFFGGYPVAGGLSRTAVNADAGARSGIAALVTAALVAVALLGMTHLFEDLPIAVLAAIILTAVTRLVDVQSIRLAWHTDRAAFLVIAVTASVTLLGVVQGILAGVVTSIMLRFFKGRT